MKIFHVDGDVVGLFTATATHFGAARFLENNIQAGVSRMDRFLKKCKILRWHPTVLLNCEDYRNIP